MITLTLRVRTDRGDNDYVVTPKVQVLFEREFKMGLPKAFAAEPRMEHLYWLAWRSVQAAGDVVKPFDEWLGQVLAVEMVESAEGPLSREG